MREPSVGVILYLLCAGVAPFAGRDPKDIVKKIRSAQYRPLREVAPHVPVRLAGLVESLLQPAPEHRPQSGQDVVAQLNEIVRDEGYYATAASISTMVTDLFPISQAAESPQIEVIRPSLTDSSLSRVSGSMSISPTMTPTLGSRISSTGRAVPAELAAGSNEPMVVPPPPIRTQGVQNVQPIIVTPVPDPVVKRGLSAATLILIAAVGILLVIGMYLIVRPT